MQGWGATHRAAAAGRRHRRLECHRLRHGCRLVDVLGAGNAMAVLAGRYLHGPADPQPAHACRPRPTSQAACTAIVPCRLHCGYLHSHLPLQAPRQPPRRPARAAAARHGLRVQQRAGPARWVLWARRIARAAGGPAGAALGRRQQRPEPPTAPPTPPAAFCGAQLAIKQRAARPAAAAFAVRCVAAAGGRPAPCTQLQACLLCQLQDSPALQIVENILLYLRNACMRRSPASRPVPVPTTLPCAAAGYPCRPPCPASQSQSLSLSLVCLPRCCAARATAARAPTCPRSLPSSATAATAAAPRCRLRGCRPACSS